MKPIITAKVKNPEPSEIVIFYARANGKPITLIPKNESELLEICSQIEEKLFREQCQKAIEKHFGKVELPLECYKKRNFKPP